MLNVNKTASVQLQAVVGHPATVPTTIHAQPTLFPKYCGHEGVCHHRAGMLQVRIAELLADREALAALEAEKAAAEAQKQRLMHELDAEARRVRNRSGLWLA